MLNFGNLNDVEFEYLCQDVMSRKLNVKLERFSSGRDGGIDLTDDAAKRNIIIQVKHYEKTTVSGLISALKRELDKVKKNNPKQYYVCCSKELTVENKREIYDIFAAYMDSPANIITRIEINDFLTEPENEDILRKHFKLWLESTNILSTIFTSNICIDCEALLCDIEDEQRMFVQTSAFEQALKNLEKCNVLMLIGNPGVGKTITSKMLVLHYASLGYKVRYTTDGSDLSTLKKSLSLSADTKEVILLDDCFGQAYFSMKESQENELLALIKYVKLTPNKILILNSRVTIYHEAKERSLPLSISLEKKDFRIHILEVSNIPPLEKAKILYNHLYFKKMPEEFFNKIKENKLYQEIIDHPNYNPRIIEYICNPIRLRTLSPDSYPRFIRDCLKNPEQVWKNEYERRLSEPDRIFLATLFSLTNTTISVEVLKNCYNSRITTIHGMDQSINHFEQSLTRLSEGLVKVIDKGNKMLISMANPSINDFMRERLEKNPPEKTAILNAAKSVLQLKRLLDKDSFEETLANIFSNGTILNFIFENSTEQYSFITYYCATHKIRNDVYSTYIKSYLYNMASVSIFEKLVFTKEIILEQLLTQELIDFYRLASFFADIDWLEDTLREFCFPEVVDLIASIYPYVSEKHRDPFIELAKATIDSSIVEFCNDVWAGEYDIDIKAIADSCKSGGGFGQYSIDSDDMESMIESEIEEQILVDIRNQLRTLPADISLDKTFLDQLSINISGADQLVRDYFDIMPDYDDEYRYPTIPHLNEIDSIFNR